MLQRDIVGIMPQWYNANWHEQIDQCNASLGTACQSASGQADNASIAQRSACSGDQADAHARAAARLTFGLNECERDNSFQDNRRCCRTPCVCGVVNHRSFRSVTPSVSHARHNTQCV